MIPQILVPLMGGIVGTVVMTLFLLVPRWMKIAHVDVIRAVGVLCTGKLEKALVPGFVIHFGSGILFAYIYYVLLSLSHLPLNALTGALAGTLHGAIVMFLVCIVVMEHHPMQRYHSRGPMTGFAQLLAHILYGITVGFVVQVLHGIV